MCGGGGSGGSGTQKYEWNDALAPYWGQALSWGEALTDPSGFGAYDQYGGQRIAGMNNDQQTAFQQVRNINSMSASPIDAMNAATWQTEDTLNGQYLNGAGADPYANSSNPYMGNSPQFRDVLNSGLQDIATNYQNGTAADTTRMFNLSGAFGGSAHQNAVGNNEAALGKTMSNYMSGMQNDQYNRSAGLAESGLQRGSSAYQNERGRMVGAIGAGNDQQALGLERANANLGIGDAQRSYQQDLLNQGYSDWSDQQNQQYKMLDYLTGILGRAQGGVSPNMTTTQSGYQASPYSQILGAGLLGYGAMR
jgi:hypothetical protein